MVYMCVYICVYVCMYLCVCVCVYICVCVYVCVRHCTCVKSENNYIVLAFFLYMGSRDQTQVVRLYGNCLCHWSILLASGPHAFTMSTVYAEVARQPPRGLPLSIGIIVQYLSV